MKIDCRKLRGIRRAIQKTAERMEKLLECKKIPCGYTTKCESLELTDVYDNLRYAVKLIDEYRERKEQNNG